MRGEISSAKFAKRHPLDWYREEHWVSWQLFVALSNFERERKAGLKIWDPSAGAGAIGATFAEQGFPIVLSDVVRNLDASLFDPEAGPLPNVVSADFLETKKAPAPCSIVCNPPYSYIKGIAEAFARHALKLATGRVCMLLPIKWLSSQARFGLFMEEHPPRAVLVLTQRPSMPPGDRIQLMGKRAFRNGMIDYCWIVWDCEIETLPGETRMVWLPPLGQMHSFAPPRWLA